MIVTLGEGLAEVEATGRRVRVMVRTRVMGVEMTAAPDEVRRLGRLLVEQADAAERVTPAPHEPRSPGL